MREDGSFGPVSMNSLNHYAFGAVCEWLYRYAAGINPVEEAPGFRRSLLRPMPNSLLKCASAHVDTAYGRLASSWALNDGEITLRFEVPFNTTAQIVLPDAEGTEVLENGAPAQGACFTRGSGVWEYTYRYNGNTIDKRVIADVDPRK